MRRCRKSRQVNRRPKPKTRAERRHLPTRCRKMSGRAPHARRYDLWPGAWCPDMAGHPWARVELRIARSRAWMLREAFLLGSTVATDAGTQGCVCSLSHRPREHGRSPVIRGLRGRIATVLLNEVDLLNRPSEIGAHEMTHAAMRFLDSRSVRLTGSMAEEEVLCYTVGELVRQMNNIFYAHSYRRPH